MCVYAGTAVGFKISAVSPYTYPLMLVCALIGTDKAWSATSGKKISKVA